MTSRALFISLLLPALAACGDGIEEYEVTAEAVEQFHAQAEELAARDDANAPLAFSVLASNQIDVPPGVQVWNPDVTLRTVGIKNADLIALIDDRVPSQEYRSSFAANQEPFANATEQYVHFVSELLALRESRESVLLTVYPQYKTIAEREEHGRLHAKEPTLIRLVFR